MKISVVVPVRDEEDSIRELLDNLLAQTRLPDEIVIADGGSKDRTREIIREFIHSGKPVRLIEIADGLPGRNRNAAAENAKFEWLGFIDAGTRPDSKWLESLATRAMENVDVVYGTWNPVLDSFFKECAAIAYLPPPALIAGVLTRPRSIASALMRREVWRRAGGFPEHLRSAEDLLFMNRLEANGARTVYEPRGLVYWNIKPTFASTFRRFVSYSRNNIRAGLWREWQAAIFRRYAFLMFVSLPALMLGIWWLLMPLVLWLLMLLARAFVSLRRNRNQYPATAGRNLKRLFMLIPIIAVLDGAAIVGTLEWLFKDSFRKGESGLLEARDGT